MIILCVSLANTLNTILHYNAIFCTYNMEYEFNTNAEIYKYIVVLYYA